MKLRSALHVKVAVTTASVLLLVLSIEVGAQILDRNQRLGQNSNVVFDNNQVVQQSQPQPFPTLAQSQVPQQPQNAFQNQPQPQQNVVVPQQPPQSQVNYPEDTINRLLDKVLRGKENFELDMFARTSRLATSQNLDFTISPFNIWALMLLVTEGAQGQTLNELVTTLGLPTDLQYTRNIYTRVRNALDFNSKTVEILNSLVLLSDQTRPLDNDYTNIAERDYKTDHFPINFLDTNSALEKINGYVKNATRGHIERILSSDDLRDAALVLASALYFKGQWMLPFNRSHTTDMPFYDDNGVEAGKVNMMFQRGAFPYTAIAELEAHILELPYDKQNQLSMIILLPRKGQPLYSVISRLASVGLPKIFQELRKAEHDFEEDEVEVYLPRFAIKTEFVMNVILDEMGIRDVFSANHADLTKISRIPLYLSRLVHKTRIEVTEEGTVASAVTAGIFANKATPPRFLANRPFAFLITQQSTNTVLFCGQYTKPTKF